jgi:transposase
MPKILRARVAHDEKEEKQVRKLAGSRHGPADWILHARIVALSWDGQRVEAIAQQLHCSPQTVRRRLQRFDAEGIEGLGDRPKAGRPRRLTTQDDSRIIALVQTTPPGRLGTVDDAVMVARDEQAEAQWSLEALARAAQDLGIQVKSSQVRRILLKEKVRWRGTHSWGTPRDKDFVPKEQRSSAITPSPRKARRPSAPTNWDRESHAASIQLPAGPRRDTASKRHWTTGVIPKRPGCMEPCACAMAKS